jgi:uncharacterized protein (DUF1501 family)
MSHINRREFMMGCSTAIAAMTGSKLSSVALAEADGGSQTLITVFLRGGWDALSVLPPLDGKDREYYEAARPTLKVPTKGDNKALDLNAQLGLHPSLAPLLELYQAGHLAIIPATGMPSNTRSHFDAQEYLELGTPDARTSPSGWVTRFLTGTNKPGVVANLLSESLSMTDELPASVRGNLKAVGFPNFDGFQLADDAEYRKFLNNTLTRLWDGDQWLHQAGLTTLRAVETITKINTGEYKPAGDAKYPEDGEFSKSLKTLARVMKAGLGVRAATVDLGGWDTHQYQGEKAQGYFGNLLSELARGLAAFFTDLDGLRVSTTVVVMSEFGRRLDENGSYGTDHGHGSAMLVLGGSVAGGKVYGKFPGLAPDQLFDRADLAVTTDYRTVLLEVMQKRFGLKNSLEVFPNFKPGAALGIMK